MRHVAPVVRAVVAVRGRRRVVDEAIDAASVERRRQVVDAALGGRVPVDVGLGARQMRLLHRCRSLVDLREQDDCKGNGGAQHRQAG